MGHIIECEDVGLEKIRHNRHHLLYPKRAWTDAGTDAQYIRGVFVVDLPVDFHNELHREIDKKLGDEIRPYHLPSEQQLAKMAEMVRDNQAYLVKMSPIKKLLWLWTKVPDIDQSVYFRTLITQEINFLRTRRGRY